MPALRVAAAARLRVDPDLLDLHRARRPRRGLGLEEDRAVLVPEPRAALLELRARAPPKALGIAPAAGRLRSPPGACVRRRARAGRGRRASPPAGPSRRARAAPRSRRRAGPGRSARGRGIRWRATSQSSPTARSSPMIMRGFPREAARRELRAAHPGGNDVRADVAERGQAARRLRPPRIGRARGAPRPRGRRARPDPRHRTPARGREADRRSSPASPRTVGAVTPALPVAVARRLDPVAAHRHRAPAAGAVLRAVVEDPAADVPRTGLEPRPGAVGHGRVDDADDPAEGAVDPGRVGEERRPAVGAEADDEAAPPTPPPRASRGSHARRRSRCCRAAARAAPHGRAAPASGRPRRAARPPRSGRPRPPSDRLERGGVGQLLDAVLEVDRVDEGLHQPERLGRRRSPTRILEHVHILDTSKVLTLVSDEMALLPSSARTRRRLGILPGAAGAGGRRVGPLAAASRARAPSAREPTEAGRAQVRRPRAGGAAPARRPPRDRPDARRLRPRRGRAERPRRRLPARQPIHAPVGHARRVAPRRDPRLSVSRERAARLDAQLLVSRRTSASTCSCSRRKGADIGPIAFTVELQALRRSAAGSWTRSSRRRCSRSSRTAASRSPSRTSRRRTSRARARRARQRVSSVFFLIPFVLMGLALADSAGDVPSGTSSARRGPSGSTRGRPRTMPPLPKPHRARSRRARAFPRPVAAHLGFPRCRSTCAPSEGDYADACLLPGDPLRARTSPRPTSRTPSR